MLELNWKPLRSCMTAGLMAIAAVSTLVPVAPAWAQNRTLPDFTDLVEQVGPSVVNIRTLEKVKASASGSADEQMLEFFRRFGIPVPPNMPRAPRPDRSPQPDEDQPRGVGSGFILTADGFVMTNAHVVEGADEVIVTLTDKREFKAKIIGADKRSDVAVVKIEATGLPAVKIGDINRLKVGEWVMAIGSPFGLENTVTAGIVSAKQRDTGDYLPFIQTDVAINPGNSGGPLINMRGEVVGINSQIYSRSGGFQGISFSIPIDEAARVSDQLRSTGKVTRGRIGVQIDQVTKEVAESIGLGKAQGAWSEALKAAHPQKSRHRSRRHHHQVRRQADREIQRPAAHGGQCEAGHQGGGDGVQARRQQRPVGHHRRSRAGKTSPQGSGPEPKPPVAGPAQALGLVVSEVPDAQKKELKIKGGVKVDTADAAAARAGLEGR
jgi:serine protease Do